MAWESLTAEKGESADRGDRDRRPLRGRKILIVEDEPIIAFALEDMVGRLGCQDVVYAPNVKTALAELSNAPPDAVVLDVNLGHETAYPVAEKLEAAHIPYLFATAGPDNIRPDLAHHPVVAKPFDVGAVAAALSSMLAR